MKNNLITDTINQLPHLPGVYLFYDNNDVVIYVGKAKDLRKRVSQYFQSKGNISAKTQVLVSKIHRIEHTVVDSEQNALLLENNLIKNYQPKYNILLKDGKTYPWIVIKNENFPRIILTRRKNRGNGDLYYGPYSSTYYAKGLIELIHSIYPLRTCSLSFEKKGEIRLKPCLNYHIKKCLGPCIGEEKEEHYMFMVANIKEILKGNSYTLIKEMENDMNEAAEKYEFELAQEYKDKITILKNYYISSLVVNSRAINSDVFSVVYDEAVGFGNYLKVRNGAIIASVNMELLPKIEETPEYVLSKFIAEVYSKYPESDSVSEVIVPYVPDQEFFGKKYLVPIKGDKKKLLELSQKNANMLNPNAMQEKMVSSLQELLELEVPPLHIECFDNSNLLGTNAVSACVVFKNGSPSKKDYRIFNVKTVEGPNDYATMKEVLHRRYSRLLAENGKLPDLIVLDGGKGQISMAHDVFRELGLTIPYIGLAERLERIVIPGEREPLVLDKNSPALRLIMQLRDEAHRYGITRHRRRRSKSALVSELDNISGIGSKTKESLLLKYKTVSRIKSAPYEELVELIGKKRADILKEALFT